MALCTAQKLGSSAQFYVEGATGGVRALLRDRHPHGPGFIHLGARWCGKVQLKGEPIKTRDIPKIDLKRSVR